MKFVTLVCSLLFCLPSFAQEKFPDGTLIPDWFRQNEIVNIETLGSKYKITDHGVVNRSEERRVGKECRSRWSPYH